MSDLDRIVNSLEGRKEGRDWRCRCPVHDGHHLIVTDKRGKLEMHCMSGAKRSEIVAALADLQLDIHANGHSPETKPRGDLTFVEEYFYYGTNSKLIAIKGRFADKDGRKSFLWRLPGDSTEGLKAHWPGFRGRIQGEDLPLFGSEHLTKHSEVPVWFVEGEKAALACRRQGLLAVCAYAGTSTPQTALRVALKALNDRQVILWPDNDAPGRSYMEAVAKLLPSARVISPAVEPRGDAYDYFRDGGSMQDLLELLVDGEPTARVDTRDDGVIVSIPKETGWVRFNFEAIEESRHALEADVSIWQEIPDVNTDRFSTRLNLLSSSGRDTVRRQLDDMYGKREWTSLLSLACSMAQEAQRNRDWALNLDGISTDDLAYLVKPFVLRDGPTVLFGHGGTGKSYIALQMAIAVITGQPFLGLRSEKMGPVLYVDYESTPGRTKLRLQKLGLTNTSQFIYWPGRGTLSSMLPALERKVKTAGIVFLVVDSALPASGAPQDEILVERYFGALAKLKLPSLTLAHSPKGDTRGDYAFGSAYWHNLARSTWNIQASDEEEQNPKHVALFNRKANEDSLHKPIGVRLAFGPAVVGIDREEVHDLLSEKLKLSQRVLRLLRDGAKATCAIAQELEVSTNAVRATVARLNRATLRATKVGVDEHKCVIWGLFQYE